MSRFWIFACFAVGLTVAGVWPAFSQAPGEVRAQGQQQGLEQTPVQSGDSIAGSDGPGPDALPSPSIGAAVPGKVRAQGREVIPEKSTPSIRIVKGMDYKEVMRRFVRDISVFAHQHRSDFLIVAQNGLDLLTKGDTDSEGNQKTSPALGYMYALDGILQEELFYGGPNSESVTNRKTPAEKKLATPKELKAMKKVEEEQKKTHESILEMADRAKKGGLKVMVMDYTKDRREISQSFRKNAARGYISFAAPARGINLNHLPSYARYPYNENGRSVLSLQKAKNFIAIRNSSPFGLPEDFAYEIRETNFDLVVVDVFHGTVPLPKKVVQRLKFKKLGAQRLVFAYVNIGRAARYRYYWNSEWRPGSPGWLGPPLSGSPDQHRVDYWNREWQQIISGDENSYIYGIVKQGFDGVILDGVDSYKDYTNPDVRF